WAMAVPPSPTVNSTATTMATPRDTLPVIRASLFRANMAGVRSRSRPAPFAVFEDLGGPRGRGPHGGHWGPGAPPWRPTGPFISPRDHSASRPSRHGALFPTRHGRTPPSHPGVHALRDPAL